MKNIARLEQITALARFILSATIFYLSFDIPQRVRDDCLKHPYNSENPFDWHSARVGIAALK